MAEQKSLIETLRNTSQILAALRKAIATSGHLNSLTEIDSLVAVALAEANRRIATASH